MNHRLLLLVLFVCVILPGTVLFVKPGFIDGDSYYWMNYVCHPMENRDYASNSPLGAFIFQYFPCNELIVKGILFFLLLMDLIAIYFIVDFLFPQQGLYGLLFSITTPIIFWYSLKFENDCFAIPFMFTSFYFYLKFFKNKNLYDLILSLGLILIAAGFWGGSLYYLFAYSIYVPELLFGLALFLFIPQIPFGEILKQLSDALLPIYTVQESNPFAGIYYFILYFIHFKKIDFFMHTLTIIFFFVGLMNPKFLILGLPLFILAMVKNYNEIGEKAKETMILFSTVFGMAFIILMLSVSPTPNEQFAIKEGLNLSKDLNKSIANDWDLGHLVFYYGGTTKQLYGGPNNFNNIKNHVVISKEDLNCVPIKTFEEPLNLLEIKPQTKIYNC